MMEAIILAGGKGTRLSSVVKNLPKALAPINGKPFLEIVIDNLCKQGVTKIILSVGYLADQIYQNFGDVWSDIEISYIREDKPLGTGGALRASLRAVQGSHALVLNGDTFLDFSITDLQKDFLRHGKPIITTRQVDDSIQYGSVGVNEDTVVSFNEKSENGESLVNAGVYLLPVDLFDTYDLPENFSFEKDFLEKYAGSLGFRHITCKGFFLDIGTPKDYALAQETITAN
jgi:D-glycero-alpha-D-manno-heptose 1-phosphate guanylyltransferase